MVEFSELKKAQDEKYAKKREEIKASKENLKALFASRYGMKKHPKLDKVFKLAWEAGNQYSDDEVEYWFTELSDLVKEEN